MRGRVGRAGAEETFLLSEPALEPLLLPLLPLPGQLHLHPPPGGPEGAGAPPQHHRDIRPGGRQQHSQPNQGRQHLGCDAGQYSICLVFSGLKISTIDMVGLR